MDIQKIKALSQNYYNELAKHTKGPNELGFVLFLMQVNLFLSECSTSVDEYLSEYNSNFKEWTK